MVDFCKIIITALSIITIFFVLFCRIESEFSEVLHEVIENKNFKILDNYCNLSPEEQTLFTMRYLEDYKKDYSDHPELIDVLVSMNINEFEKFVNLFGKYGDAVFTDPIVDQLNKTIYSFIRKNELWCKIEYLKIRGSTYEWELSYILSSRTTMNK